MPPSVPAAHVLPWEWIRKPDGRISCQDEGWVTFYHFLFSSALPSHGSHFSIPFTCFRPRWLRKALFWWSVWGKNHKHKDVATNCDRVCVLNHIHCFWFHQVLMRYGRQRWRLRGRMEVSNKQIWDGEENIFLPLVTELLSIKVRKSNLKRHG